MNKVLAAIALALLAPPLLAQEAVPTAPTSAAKPAAPAPARARILTLDGRSLEGTGLKAADGQLAVLLDKGEASVDLADVLEASIELPGPASSTRVPGSPAAPAVEVELVNRDLLRGVLLRGKGEEGFVLRNTALGEIEVAFENVASVRFLAGSAKAEDPPPLEAGKKGDRVLFATGDRIEGTVRSVAPTEVKFRSADGSDRTVPVEGLLGIALADLPRKAAAGLRCQVALVDGTRITGTVVETTETAWKIAGTLDGKERVVPSPFVAGLAVRGGRGVPLSDLVPASVAIRPYWGDDPPVLPLQPRFDRAFNLDRGTPPPIRLGARTYYRGLSCFSGTTLTYDLPAGAFKSFVATVGVDDGGPKGAVEFEVLLDGRSAWKSGVVRTVPVAMPRLDLAAAKTLVLVVHPGPDDDVQDFADWVKAALLP
jgi:hypothetical protein